MTPTGPKHKRAVDLFTKGHSCAYVAEVTGVAYSRVTRFREELDIMPYEAANDPSRASMGRWGGLSTKPPRKRAAYGTSGGHAMTPAFHVKRCRFPLWPHGAGPTQEFCGAKTWRPGASYCREHHARCYV